MPEPFQPSDIDRSFSAPDLSGMRPGQERETDPVELDERRKNMAKLYADADTLFKDHNLDDFMSQDRSMVDLSDRQKAALKEHDSMMAVADNIRLNNGFEFPA